MSARAIAPTETATLTVYQLPESPAYQLRKPLLVEIERDEEGSFVVSEPSTGIFHYDKDLGVAVTAFLRVFVAEFEFLREHEGELSASMIAELDRMQQILVPAA